jgi:pimeloyl-ACP methyl ester carboxylesterase
MRYFPKAPDPAFDARLGREIGAYAQLVRRNGQGNPKLAQWLHRISAPTLLLWGGADRMRPTAQADTWMKLLPDAQLQVVPDTGHLVFEETPAAIDVVANFLDGQAVSTSN